MNPIGGQTNLRIQVAVDAIRDLAQQAQSLKDKAGGTDGAGAAPQAEDSSSPRDTLARRARELAALASSQPADGSGADGQAPARSYRTLSGPPTLNAESVIVTLSSSFDGLLFTHGNDTPSAGGAGVVLYKLKWGEDPVDVASTIRDDGTIDRGALFARAVFYEGAERWAMANLHKINSYVSVSGSGDVTVTGGVGNDAISASADDVLVDGGAGDDMVWAGAGATVLGGEGADAISGLDRLTASGGDGNDEIGGYDDVVLDGGAGDDHLSGRDNSWIAGGDGNDLLQAYDHSVVDGGAGNDVIWVKNDSRVEAGSGDDVVFAMAGSRIDAGSGDDIVTARERSEVRGGTGNDDIAVGAGSTVHFGRGDGMDRLTLTADTLSWTGRSAALGKAEGVTVTFEDISIKDLDMSVEGDDIRLSFGGGDGILLVGALSGAAPDLRFKDGAVDAATLRTRDITV